eukprot:1158738-Pelagomonas_calceolata.AAC.1
MRLVAWSYPRKAPCNQHSRVSADDRVVERLSSEPEGGWQKRKETLRRVGRPKEEGIGEGGNHVFELRRNACLRVCNCVTVENGSMRLQEGACK